MSNKPLEGIRVIDCTHVLAGPFCAYQLGMLGADVTRVEPVVVSDSVRLHGPRDDMNGKGLGAGFLGQGANKRAIGLMGLWMNNSVCHRNCASRSRAARS